MDNLFADLPQGAPAEEIFTELLARPGLRIARIVSTGQASPPGFWYDQPEGEWVILLSGSAMLRFADEDAPRQLAPGDYVHIPPRRKHRVDATSATEPSVWLAVHYAPAPVVSGGRR